jgi:hypothetical protein
MEAEPSLLRKAGDTLKHELIVWAWISAYLFVLFSAILLYGWAKAGTEGRALAEIGFAALQAVVLGKFVLFGKIFGLGRMPREEALIIRVLRRTAGVLLVVAGCVVGEEMLMAVVRGGSPLDGLNEILGRGAADLGISMLLMFLILLPLAVLLEFSRHIPPAEIRALLFGRRA